MVLRLYFTDPHLTFFYFINPKLPKLACEKQILSSLLQSDRLLIPKKNNKHVCYKCILVLNSIQLYSITVIV